MAGLKTKKTTASVEDFLDAIKDEERRSDCHAIVKLMKKVTKAEPKMWGPAIVGFGDYRYVYDSGREGDWFKMGFSPRKQNLTLYSMGGLARFTSLLKKLGKHKTGKGCLYIDRLADIDKKVLEKLLSTSLAEMKKHSEAQKAKLKKK
ncbi:MAG TPA: DUF1801 domain-containing protein [Bacteroidia bacterium]|nr:DUF1801 domain-containing protein [Bacteroidia bacterium]